MFLFQSCSKDKNEIQARMIIESNKITCTDCFDFTRKLEIYDNQVFISDLYTLWIIDNIGQDMELNQTITSSPGGSLRNFTINNSILALGSIDENGTGKVSIYEKIGNQWLLFQEITIGVMGDDFGTVIDIEDDIMVIGASSLWIGGQAKIYIYHKESEYWELKDVFSLGDSYFRMAAEIYDNYIMAGIVFADLNIFHYNNENWSLVKTENISPVTINHVGNEFLIATESDVLAFTFNPDETFSYHNLQPGFELLDISGHGEIIEMMGNIALIDSQNNDLCYQLEFTDDKWVNTKVFKPGPGESCTFEAMEITNDYFILGGSDDLISAHTGYVYFIDR